MRNSPQATQLLLVRDRVGSLSDSKDEQQVGDEQVGTQVSDGVLRKRSICPRNTGKVYAQVGHKRHINVQHIKEINFNYYQVNENTIRKNSFTHQIGKN